MTGAVGCCLEKLNFNRTNMKLQEVKWRFTKLILTPQKLSPPLFVPDGQGFVQKSFERLVEYGMQKKRCIRLNQTYALPYIKQRRELTIKSLKEYYDALIREQGEPDWERLKRQDFPDPVPHFDGKAYEPEFDYTRLSKAIRKTYDCMKDSRWRTLAEICEVTGGREASESARLRDFRKEKFGNHTVDRRRRGNPKDGLFEYRLLIEQ